MIRINKTFSSHDQEGMNKYYSGIRREKGNLLGTTTVTRHSPDGTATDSTVTIYAEIPRICAELDIDSAVEEIDNS